MSSKSKKINRNIAINNSKNINTASVTADSSSSNNPAANTYSTARAAMSPGANRTAAPLNYPYFGKDIRWTGIVTVIVAVLMVVAYIVFH